MISLFSDILNFSTNNAIRSNTHSLYIVINTKRIWHSRTCMHKYINGKSSSLIVGRYMYTVHYVDVCIVYSCCWTINKWWWCQYAVYSVCAVLRLRRKWRSLQYLMPTECVCLCETRDSDGWLMTSQVLAISRYFVRY